MDAKGTGSMSRTVWKFEFAICDDAQIANMPNGAKLLHVTMQGNRLCLWAEVKPDMPIFERKFFVHGTGHPIPYGRNYVGTAHDGPFVWHLYEGK